MHPRSTLSNNFFFPRPSPKRSLSCAGLDDLDELLHSSDNVRATPNRKRHHSLNNDNNFTATNFGTPSSPSRHDYPPPPASYPGALRRPELPAFSEKNSSSGGFQLVPSASSSFESRYTQASSNQAQAIDRHHPDGQDNNYQEEHDFDSEFSGQDASSGDDHEYKSSGHFLTSQDSQDAPAGGGASITPVFPFPSHLPTPTHSASSGVILPAKSTSGDDKDVDSPILQLKEEKLERDDLVLQATPASSAGPDPSVPMDDENMNSFLDSVALELDDIME
ncbi:hypothetical protein JG687_00013624 [Phytophthora cactorum]|uniref:Uncharacterized protein n=1 Tax=Phytophthora cactorum TaxID=29920 RepID=A0A8T1TYR2_9STRA|nr:hypothetical protein JG687_00013624 [Phytophthora cactorum]